MNADTVARARQVVVLRPYLQNETKEDVNDVARNLDYYERRRAKREEEERALLDSLTSSFSSFQIDEKRATERASRQFEPLGIASSLFSKDFDHQLDLLDGEIHGKPVAKLLKPVVDVLIDEMIMETVNASKRWTAGNADECRRVDQALDDMRPKDELIIRKFRMRVHRRDMVVLKPGKWLTDESINFFMKLLGEKCEQAADRQVDLPSTTEVDAIARKPLWDTIKFHLNIPPNVPAHTLLLNPVEGDVEDWAHSWALRSVQRNMGKVFFFHSFFFTALLGRGGYDYESVKSWTTRKKRVDLFTYDRVIIPVNCGNMHWTLAVAHIKLKAVQYLDSFRSPGSEYMEALLRYLNDESLDKRSEPLDLEEWRIIPPPSDLPRQHNGCDCGAFLCMYADYLSDNQPFDFSQSDMNFFRRYIARSIVIGKVL